MDPELRTFEEQMDFLAADEQEAIEGYEKIINIIADEHVKQQLIEILEEEKAHKNFLEAVKLNPSISYKDPLPNQEIEELEFESFE